MLAKVTPAHIAAFDRPEVRQRIAEKLELALETAKKSGNPLRKDYENALRFLSMPGGIKNLQANVGKGLLPVGMAAVLLPYVLEEGDKEPAT
jgi:hypothetical protein